MEQTVNINSEIINFKLNEGGNCWQSKTTIDNSEIEIEIDFLFHIEREIDWQHLKEFIEFIKKDGILNKLVNDSKHLVAELGKAFFRDNLDEVLDYRMKFNNSIIYKGKTDGSFAKDGYSFSLAYNYLVEKNGRIDGDSYGLYLVHIENNSILGVSRHQC